MLQYINIGRRKITIEDLRKYCGILSNEYQKYSHLKNKVIEKAKLEINTKTEYNIDYREIKESCKVVEIEWTIQKKDNQTEEQSKKLESLQKELRSERIIIDNLVEYGFGKTINDSTW